MADIQLDFGRDSVRLSFEDNRYAVLDDPLRPKPLSDVEIGEALDAPIGSPGLDEICSYDQSVLIVVSDATRATASAQVVNLLVRRLIQYGISPSNIAVIFATGIHRPVNEQEKVELLTPFIAQRVRVLNHDATDAAQMLSLGTTDRGTPVDLNRALTDYSLVITTGVVGFHYFAGFTGGRKSICPGLASARTIQATHMLAFDFDTGGRRQGVDTAQLSGNLVSEECERIAAMRPPSFGITTEVDHVGRAVNVYCGHWQASHQAACSEYLATHSMLINQRRDLVIVSCGGFPYDINLIQAHKALDMAAKACREGGIIVLLAQCEDGLGRGDFLKWFSEKDSGSLASRLRDAYEVNGQTAWALLTKTERYRVHLVSRLPAHEVKLMRMIPAHSLSDVLRALPDTEGFIMPRGAAILPRVENAATLS